MDMTKRRAALRIGLAFCAAALAVDRAAAQLTPPAAKPADGAMLFKQQCATCHTTNISDPPRQGPTLFNIVGRDAGTADGFRHLAVVVDDLDAEHARFSREKLSPGPLRDFKHDGATLARFFFVSDPDGYKIEVIQKGGRFG